MSQTKPQPEKPKQVEKQKVDKAALQTVIDEKKKLLSSNTIIKK